MNYFVQHWTFDPMVIVVILTVFAHEVGLSRLRQHSRASRTKSRRRRSFVFYVGLIVLVLTIISPIDYWASSYFFVHMIEHIMLSFLVPVLIVLGAPWVPLLFALPVGPRRRVGRFVFLSPRTRAVRSIGRVLRNPWFALISFNAAMLVWHIPSWFDLAERNGFVHVWLMHGSFIVTGVLFWLQIFPSSPMKPERGVVWQVGAILSTNVIMTVLAISMSILTAVSWYTVYSHIPGVTLSPFADQQIGAAILWVCGDFWAAPALGIVIRRGVETEGSIGQLLDRMTGRGELASAEGFRGDTLTAEPRLVGEATAE